jgi:hypothetical protein
MEVIEVRNSRDLLVNASAGSVSNAKSQPPAGSRRQALPPTIAHFPINANRQCEASYRLSIASRSRFLRAAALRQDLTAGFQLPPSVGTAEE